MKKVLKVMTFPFKILNLRREILTFPFKILNFVLNLTV